MHRLVAARERTSLLMSDLDAGQLMGPRLSIVNPPLWELAHLAWSEGASCMPVGSEGLRIAITADGELFSDPADDDCAMPMP